MATFDSEVTVSSAAKRVNGKSMMHLIASGFQKGTELIHPVRRPPTRPPSWKRPVR